MNIEHQPDAHRFAAVLPEGTAELEYTLKDRTLTITHTYVPNAARGHGVASKLMAAALEYADAQGLTVVPLCSFAVSYMAREERRSARS